MAIVNRSFRATESDAQRIGTLRDRWPRANASEVIRAALLWFSSTGQHAADSFADVADSLAAELKKEDAKVAGFTLPEDEAEALDELVAKPTPGARRRFSRTEIVRIALVVFSRISDDEMLAAREAVRRLVPGPKKDEPLAAEGVETR